MKISDKEKIELYKKMIEIRNFEETVAELYRNGKVPGSVHLYIGEEAVASGVCAALNEKDYVYSTHRGHGHCLAKGADPKKLLAELCGKETGYCNGKSGSMHVFVPEINFMGTNGIVSGGLTISTGAGMSIKLKGTNNVSVCFFGDGASNNGTFHEALNLASIWNLPVIFVCENNMYATATPISRAAKVKNLSIRAAGYDIRGVTVDGNDVLEVYEKAKEAVDAARKGIGPTLIECKTYRICGHYEGDHMTGYRTQDEIDIWKQKDPIKKMRGHLLNNKILTEEEIREIETEIQEEIKEAVDFALASSMPVPENARTHVFCEVTKNLPEQIPLLTSGREITYVAAVREAMRIEFLRDKSVFIMGEGIASRGGPFTVSLGLLEEFGSGRVIDTPISEAGFTGLGVGAACCGMRPIVDLMFVDFSMLAMDQIVNQAAKIRYLTDGKISVPMVIRMACGAGKSGGCHHSQSFHSLFMNIPGLKVVMPSNPYDAKGLLITAIRDNDPVIFLEPRILYNTKGFVPEDEYAIPFGKASVCREGKDVTLVAIGAVVKQSLEAAEILQSKGISVEVIDPRTLVPLDKESILSSLRKTGHLAIVDEGYAPCGFGAEISAIILEEGFDYLDGKIQRLHSYSVPIPFSPTLEHYVIPNKEKIIEMVIKMFL